MSNRISQKIGNFWNLAKETRKGEPLVVLAPMINVTDEAFRRIIARYGKPDAFFTEFTSVDGLCSAGREALLTNFLFDESERPIIAQVFGRKPEHFIEAARLVRELGFDGLDINMGCPDKAVIKQGAGVALIREPKLAQEIIIAAKEGASEMPVSVKTRLGFSENVLETWLPALLDVQPAAVTIHARTKKEMSDVPAHWDQIKRAVEIRNSMKSQTFILGNGDVIDLADAKTKAQETGADGVMMGRAIFGNPWAFNSKVVKRNLALEEILRVMLEHATLFEELFGSHAPQHRQKNFLLMRKHFGAYVSGFSRSKKLRARLMETTCAKDVQGVIEWYLSSVVPELAGTKEADAKPQTWAPHY